MCTCGQNAHLVKCGPMVKCRPSTRDSPPPPRPPAGQNTRPVDPWSNKWSNPPARVHYRPVDSPLPSPLPHGRARLFVRGWGWGSRGVCGQACVRAHVREGGGVRRRFAPSPPLRRGGGGSTGMCRQAYARRGAGPAQRRPQTGRDRQTRATDRAGPTDRARPALGRRFYMA